MRIKITERFRPFSHLPGTTCMLPNTSLSFMIFPTKIVVKDHQYKHPAESILTNNLQGPIEKYLVLCDLEKAKITVQGFAKGNFFKYDIIPSETSFSIQPNKYQMKWQSSELLNPLRIEKQTSAVEKLHLGVTKKLDWDLIKRRSCMNEIIPLWFYLGQQIPYVPPSDDSSLLSKCEKNIFLKDKNKLIEGFKDVFLAGFSGILTPRLSDEDFQGYSLPPICSESSLSLLSYGAKLIRLMFFQSVSDKEFSILPLLPSEMPCGRLLGIRCDSYGSIDLEWTKKFVRRMTFKVSKSANIMFHFPKTVKQFRLTNKDNAESMIITPKDPLYFIENHTYYFDCFEG